MYVQALLVPPDSAAVPPHNPNRLLERAAVAGRVGALHALNRHGLPSLASRAGGRLVEQSVSLSRGPARVREDQSLRSHVEHAVTLPQTGGAPFCDEPAC